MNSIAQPACPTCGEPTEAKWRPFCSKRCADIDLGRWFNERYVVPVPIDPEDEEIAQGEEE